MSFKAIISNLMYREFDKGNCLLSEIDAACKFAFRLVGLSRVSVWLAFDYQCEWCPKFVALSLVCQI